MTSDSSSYSFNFETQNQITIPSGYFCILKNHFAQTTYNVEISSKNPHQLVEIWSIDQDKSHHFVNDADISEELSKQGKFSKSYNHQSQQYIGLINLVAKNVSETSTFKVQVTLGWWPRLWSKYRL